MNFEKTFLDVSLSYRTFGFDISIYPIFFNFLFFQKVLSKEKKLMHFNVAFCIFCCGWNMMVFCAAAESIYVPHFCLSASVHPCFLSFFFLLNLSVFIIWVYFAQLTCCVHLFPPFYYGTMLKESLVHSKIFLSISVPLFASPFLHHCSICLFVDAFKKVFFNSGILFVPISLYNAWL